MLFVGAGWRFFLLSGLALNAAALRSVRSPTSSRSHLRAASDGPGAAQMQVDVAIVGGGPAGTAIGFLLQEQQQCKVAIIDPRAADEAGTWYPNYGEWQDEWQRVADRMQLPELRQCTTTEWDTTDVFFGGSYETPFEAKTKLPRAYVRVDRKQMQKLLKDRFCAAGGTMLPSKLEASCIAPNLFDSSNLMHHAKGSELVLADGTKVSCRLLIDATGLESRLVQKESPYTARGVDAEIPTGYQIAYGFLTEVDSMGPYDPKAMTLFDYRTDFLMQGEGDSAWLADAEDRPTFMYVMPLRENKEKGTFTVFWEETSLVGKDARRLSFEECKKRAYKRLQYYGINVLSVEEEEFCYIPMGGELPDSKQRIVAFGGAASMVHPSTGYHACRMLAAATDVAEVIGRGMRCDSSSPAGMPDHIAAEAYKVMWSQQNRGQRDFQAYGGDFLMRQPVNKLRGFFTAFFSIEQELWSGFLAGWPGLPNNEKHETWSARFAFALQLFTKMPNDVRIAMMLYAVQYSFVYGPNSLLRSLTPGLLFGNGPPKPHWTPPLAQFGDEAAKQEARQLIKEFADKQESASEDSSSDYPSPFSSTQ